MDAMDSMDTAIVKNVHPVHIVHPLLVEMPAAFGYNVFLFLIRRGS